MINTVFHCLKTNLTLKYVIIIIFSGPLVRLVHIHHVWNASKIVTERTFNIASKVSAIWYDETGIESLKKEEVRLFTEHCSDEET